MIVLRGYQTALKKACYEAWRQPTTRVVMPVLATGSGKTCVVARIAHEWQGEGIAIAHRNELVGQLSTALAREGIMHNLIAPQNIIRQISANHMERIGRVYYNARAPWTVAGVRTLARGYHEVFARSTLIVQDEGHHVLRDNEWGRVYQQFTHPERRGLFPTATPLRADGMGLGTHHDGLVDAMVEGPQMRTLIDEGYLTDYKIVTAQPDDFDLSNVHVGASGEFNRQELVEAVKRSRHIVGKVVETYLKYANGKLGVTFATDVEEAHKLAAAYNAAGVPAEVVTAKTSIDERRSILRRFENRDLLQLVNVDLFGEGFDLPAIECVSMARATASYSLYCQQFGRALRLMVSPMAMAAWDTYPVATRLQLIAASSKPHAWIFDHVGNVYRHDGPPDRPREWSLDRRERTARNKPTDAIPTHKCLNHLCNMTFERIFTACPFCGKEVAPPARRDAPQYVDGDLGILSPEILAQMRGENVRVMGALFVPHGLPGAAVSGLTRRHHERQVAHTWLRNAMATWVHAHQVAGDTESMLLRRFFLTFGIDMCSAGALSGPDADRLRTRIADKLALAQIVINA